MMQCYSVKDEKEKLSKVHINCPEKALAHRNEMWIKKLIAKMKIENVEGENKFPFNQ